MSWFYEKSRPVETAHNGTMRLMRWFGDWRLFGHDGTEQATAYMDALWRKTMRRVRGRPTRALVLGVATGRSFTLLRRRWPGIAMVGVDWEPALFALGRELGLHRFADDDARARMVYGDATTAIVSIDGPFDLVIVDLFNGRVADNSIFADDFVADVARLVAPGGTVAVNAFRQPAAFAAWEKVFGRPRAFRYMGNHIALFRKEPSSQR